jgi:hypothetical protein
LTAIEDEAIKGYLLGRLDDSRKTQLEQRLLNDAQLFEEVLIAEDELVDHYVAGRLGEDDRARFESHFLVTPDRVRKIQFGRALHRYLELNEVPAVPTPKPFRNTLWWRPVLAFSLLFIVAVASYWIWVRKNGRGSHKTQVITLAAGAIRSSGATFPREAISEDTSTIELRLVVPDIRHRSYKADIHGETTDVKDLTSNQTLEQNGEKAVVFSVEATRLPPDDYRMRLSGTDERGESEFIDSYTFGITKR